MFAQTEVDYTGHVLTDQGVKVSAEKCCTCTIQKMPEPQNKEEVRQLLGMATYVSKYIRNFSDVTRNLREVIKQKDPEGKEKFYFDEPQKQALET